MNFFAATGLFEKIVDIWITVKDNGYSGGKVVCPRRRSTAATASSTRDAIYSAQRAPDGRLMFVAAASAAE